MNSLSFHVCDAANDKYYYIMRSEDKIHYYKTVCQNRNQLIISEKSTKEITTAFCSSYHSEKFSLPSFSLLRGSKMSKLYFFQLSFSKTVENLLDYYLYFC
jgi:hypothetical protein